ncbi:nuclear transport factor 2 family protein [Vibrio sp. T187]|uniref:nuclear transport factor 2 family protein n=1 Tax=Vibrio TaxID=662 RepID=UPI0010C9C08C|nr:MULTISPECIES: nuclear transport factor 2 family protein [Vibrio]MBW3695949.1 nuclear transport factor 2 family protein [Vibrio sp. T187]
MTAKEVVLAYWQAMQSNDFYKAAEWLTSECEVYWPQSKELIVGRENFGHVNSEYPAKGKWTFDVNRVVAEGNQVVTDVTVSDGERVDTVVTFHTVEGQLIAKQHEYWPESFEAPEWRKTWVSYAE